MSETLAAMFCYTVYNGQRVPAWATMLEVNKHHGMMAMTKDGNAVWENDQVKKLDFYVEIDKDELLLKYKGRIYDWANCAATLQVRKEYGSDAAYKLDVSYDNAHSNFEYVFAMFEMQKAEEEKAINEQANAEEEARVIYSMFSSIRVNVNGCILDVPGWGLKENDELPLGFCIRFNSDTGEFVLFCDGQLCDSAREDAVKEVETVLGLTADQLPTPPSAYPDWSRIACMIGCQEQ